jgi:hypothetical protein
LPRLNEIEEIIAGANPSFRVILSVGTRSLKPIVWRLVADELRKVDLTKNP